MAILLIILVNLFITIVFFKRHDQHNFVFSPYSVANGKGYRGWIYSHFSHANWMHLIFNMVTFYFFAPVILSMMGAPFLLLLYGISGLAADAAVFVMRRNDPRYACLGASGSVSGILFGAIILAPHINLYLMFIPIGIPAPIFAIAYLVFSFYLARRGGDYVSHEAHIGGAVAGLILTAIMSPLGLDPLFDEMKQLLSF